MKISIQWKTGIIFLRLVSWFKTDFNNSGITYNNSSSETFGRRSNASVEEA